MESVLRMKLKFKLGLSHLVTLLAVVAVLVLLASPLRRYLYSAHQHFGNTLGFSFNNIATNDYVLWIKSQTDDLEKENEGIYLNKKVAFRDVTSNKLATVLGQQSGGGEKLIDVDLSDQRLNMKEGESTIASYLISSGKWAPTLKGEWKIWTKLRYTRMRGGSKALGTFYDLPNVPYTMYYNQGYGIHGAYWHNNFGRPMSHGCVNMKPEEAGIVFNWANVGTRVVVHD